MRESATTDFADDLQAFLDQYLLNPSATGNIDPSWPDPALLGYLETKPMS
jgi:hypothetical protein